MNLSFLPLPYTFITPPIKSQLSITTEETDQTDSGDVGIINAGNPGTTGTGSGSFNQNLGATFYHPRVLGMLFILIISALSIGMLTGAVRKS